MNHQENPNPVHNSGLLRFRSAPSSLFSSFDNTETKSDSVENRGQTHFDSRDFIENYEERKPVLNGFSSNSFLNLQYPKQSSSSNLMGSNLMRQGSSPAGFFSHINPQNGYGALRGVGNYRLGQGNNTASEINPSSSRLTIPSRFSSDFPPLGTLPQISETGDENVDENNEIPKFESRYQFNSWRDSSYFPDNISVFKKELENDGKLFSSSSSQDVEIGFRGTFLSHHLSLPKTSAEIAAMDKFLHFQDTVPCKVRAKRGCATHPRSIAERVRRTRISERMRKLQELVPNMDKQTNTAEMLDLAVEYIKDLQQQYKILCENRGKCKCSSMQKSHQIL